MNFLDLIKYAGSRWYMLVIGMIVGGLAGMGAVSLLPELYESNAVFNVTIDYTQTGALSDVEEDQAMRGVGDIIFSDEIVSGTLAALEEQGMLLSKDEFYDDAIFDREEFRWAIRYRDANPQTAFIVVEAWSLEADRVLQEALEHARLASSYQGVLTGLESCLQRTTGPVSGSDACSYENIEEILAEIDQVSALVKSEKEESKGLLPALSVQLLEKAKVPSQAMRYQVNMLVLNGALIGLLIMLAVLITKVQLEKK